MFAHDLDFNTILATTGGAKPEVVQRRSYDLERESIGLRTVAALRHAEQELDMGALLTFHVDRVRLRPLAIGSRA